MPFSGLVWAYRGMDVLRSIIHGFGLRAGWMGLDAMALAGLGEARFLQLPYASRGGNHRSISPSRRRRRAQSVLILLLSSSPGLACPFAVTDQQVSSPPAPESKHLEGLRVRRQVRHTPEQLGAFLLFAYLEWPCKPSSSSPTHCKHREARRILPTTSGNTYRGTRSLPATYLDDRTAWPSNSKSALPPVSHYRRLVRRCAAAETPRLHRLL